ncbi:hypothetical protein AB2L28_19360 [Kineococcus sp. TBRC 1896]|uniref:NfeD-like C-terminal domain-containing protein n=1 Tax=Kineococcus mangrovi TaxID=1660183 RepID=A0ABV4I6T8_9ACTN
MTVHGIGVTVFVVLAVVGFVVCLVSFVFDGVFEAFELDIAGGFLSLTSLSGGLALFGLAATLAQTSFGWTTSQAAGFGAGVGIATVAGVGGLVRTLRREDPETHVSILGARGYVTTPATRPGAFGEVNLRLRGTTVKRSAVSDVTLARGAEVEVVAEVSATAVQVKPLP